LTKESDGLEFQQMSCLNDRKNKLFNSFTYIDWFFFLLSLFLSSRRLLCQHNNLQSDQILIYKIWKKNYGFPYFKSKSGVKFSKRVSQFFGTLFLLYQTRVFFLSRLIDQGRKIAPNYLWQFRYEWWRKICVCIFYSIRHLFSFYFFLLSNKIGTSAANKWKYLSSCKFRRTNPVNLVCNFYDDMFVCLYRVSEKRNK